MRKTRVKQSVIAGRSVLLEQAESVHFSFSCPVQVCCLSKFHLPLYCHPSSAALHFLFSFSQIITSKEKSIILGVCLFDEICL